MRARHGFIAVVCLALALSSAMAADEGPHWQANLDAAKRLAAQTNRLVLAHFSAPWCGPCKRLETTVFAQPGVAAAMEARFVPVKINADEWPTTARSFEIERLPTDVILTPSGQVLYKLNCPQDPGRDLAQLTQAASGRAASGCRKASDRRHKRLRPMHRPCRWWIRELTSVAIRPARQTARWRPVLPRPAHPSHRPRAGLPIRRRITPPTVVATRHFDRGNSAVAESEWIGPASRSKSAAQQTIGSQIVNAQTSLSANAASVGLDGFCPVTLVERSQVTPQDSHCWTHGNPQWGAVHRGVTYLFTGPDEQKRFLQQPDRYAHRRYRATTRSWRSIEVSCFAAAARTAFSLRTGFTCSRLPRHSNGFSRIPAVTPMTSGKRKTRPTPRFADG